MLDHVKQRLTGILFRMYGEGAKFYAYISCSVSVWMFTNPVYGCSAWTQDMSVEISVLNYGGLEKVYYKNMDCPSYWYLSSGTYFLFLQKGPAKFVFETFKLVPMWQCRRSQKTQFPLAGQTPTPSSEPGTGSELRVNPSMFSSEGKWVRMFGQSESVTLSRQSTRPISTSSRFKSNVGAWWFSTAG